MIDTTLASLITSFPPPFGSRFPTLSLHPWSFIPLIFPHARQITHHPHFRPTSKQNRLPQVRPTIILFDLMSATLRQPLSKPRARLLGQSSSHASPRDPRGAVDRTRLLQCQRQRAQAADMQRLSHLRPDAGMRRPMSLLRRSWGLLEAYPIRSRWFLVIAEDDFRLSDYPGAFFLIDRLVSKSLPSHHCAASTISGSAFCGRSSVCCL